MRKNTLVFLIFLLPFVSLLCENKLRLSPVFSDHMVVQRDTDFLIYGEGKSGSEVEILFNGKTYRTPVSADSSWQISLPPLQLKKKYDISVISGKDTIRLTDVVAGDVWLCSGQSNMEFQVASFHWGDEAIVNATDSGLRFYSVPNTIDLIPAAHLPEGGTWKLAMGDDLKECSAVAYFFGKNLRKSLEDIPVGLICSDWSGTAIEPWISLQGFAPFKQFEKEYNELAANKKSCKQIDAEFDRLRKTWDKEHYLAGKGVDEEWYLPSTDFSDWKPYKPSEGYWESQNLGLENFDGSVWFKTSFDLPTDYKGGNFHLFLSYIKDYSTVWVNGQQVGETFGDKNWSDYYVPENTLKPTENILVVRVLNVEGKGGFSFHPFWATPILNGDWVCKADEPLKPNFPVPQIVNVNPFSHPTILYNAMISPLAKYTKIKGTIWYQGESNAGRAFEYRQLLTALINDWRQKFSMPQMPFYLVQLANYDAIDTSGNNNDWAELRESQALATKLPHVKMVTAIDLGEEHDIHPKNKQDVGLRLAEVALSDCYGKTEEKKYPQINKFSIRNGQITLSCSASVISKDGKTELSGFSVAGTDRKFYPAKAQLRGQTIIVFCDQVPDPEAVRYAWAKNPGALNLYGKNGLPVLPYRSDNWKGLTDDRLYDPDIVYF